MGKIFAIGDIHGCLDKLKKLMALIAVDPDKDSIVFMGDYIDRGPDPKGVVDLVLDTKNKVNDTVCLMGNHEQMFLNYLEGLEEDLYLSNGGVCTLLSYGITFAGLTGDKKDLIPQDHLRFFTSLRTHYEKDDYVFVHAGLRPGIPIRQQDPDDMVWIRHEFIDSPYAFAKTVVFGHTPLHEVYMDETKIGVDTGAVYGGKLTCLELPERKFHQV